MAQHKILFVDDEPNVTEALMRSLRGDRYELFSAASADAAMEFLAREAIDVVVSDERMPGLSGSQFLAIVHRDYPDTVRIILTGQASMDAAIRAINEGAVYRFLTKPCNVQELKVTLRQALEHRDLTRQSRELLRRFQAQAHVIDDLERDNPGISHVATDADGAIVVSEEPGSVEDLLAEIERTLDSTPPAR
ncbi:MAG: response regulator [Acidobacteriota bacterium]